MKNKADYSKYKCPYSHLEKECGHELHGPEGYADTYGVWCPFGFRGPVFYLEPDDLRLELKDAPQEIVEAKPPTAPNSESAPCIEVINKSSRLLNIDIQGNTVYIYN